MSDRLRPARTEVLAVDVGGTFTDVLLVRGRSVVRAEKVVTDVRRPEQALQRWEPEQAHRRPPDWVHATTLATNALLGQSNLPLPRVALVTTAGFRDVIEIGRQNRPSLYDLSFVRPVPLIARQRRFEVRERTDAVGRRTLPLRPRELAGLGRALRSCHAESVAVGFLHSYLNDRNERLAGRYLRGKFPFVSLSSEVAPEPREFERFSTVAVNATLLPILSEYAGRLERAHERRGGTALAWMSSAGGLVTSREVRKKPVVALESGPAAGVIAAAALSRRLGLSRTISFDMGGTTAKAGTVVDGRVQSVPELEVGGRTHHGRPARGTGYPVRFPFLDLAEVSAGGGTIITRDRSGGLAIGPTSAGASPGPACYGRGGRRATLTDASLVLGWIGASMLGGRMPLNAAAATRALSVLGVPVAVAESALRLAELEMARAIRLVTVERGLDPARFVLLAFGGAGPQHAALVAEELGIRRVVVPPRPGLFSALGLLYADWRFEARRTFPKELRSACESLRRELRAGRPGWRTEFTADCRYRGQGSELTVPFRVPDEESVHASFRRLHRSTFGFTLDRTVEVVTLHAFAMKNRSKPHLPAAGGTGRASGRRRAVLGGRRWTIRTLDRATLDRRAQVEGPAVIEEFDSTTLIPPAWVARLGPAGELELQGPVR